MLTKSIQKMTVPERILLVEEIWDSITDHPEKMPTTQEEIAFVNARLDHLEKHPGKLIPWEHLKLRTQRKS